MDRLTILKPTRCDLKRLPLDAREAFVLSQLDGQLTLDDLAQVAGLEFIEAARLARKLVELGAVTVIESARGSGSSSDKKRRLPNNVMIIEKDDARPTRVDPRAERMSIPRMARVIAPRIQEKELPRIERAERSERSERSERLERTERMDRTERIERVNVAVSIRPGSLRPATTSSSAPKKVSSAPPRRMSRRMQRAASAKSAAIEEVCELDAAKQAEIIALDTKLEKADFYSALEIERDADKKAIKRAYFGFAAKFHPDRFFGKKLGKLKPAVDRIFRKLTLANDTLLNADDRAKYDATLPPAPLAPRTTSKAPPRSSKAPPATTTTTPTPSKAPPAGSSKAPPRSTRNPPRKPSRATRLSTARKLKKVSTKLTAPAAPTSATTAPQRSEERLKQLHQAAREAKLQSRIEMFLQAAEEALRGDDPIGAANNYRLALEHRDDPYVRSKLDEVDARARTVRFTRAMTQGRTAEREQRWSDAAMHYVRGYEARPNAEIAERAGNALLRSNGDLEKAATLVEKAVELDPDNLDFHITLGEIYLTSNRLDEAEDEADIALELAASDARAKALASAVAKRQKSARR